MLNKEIMPREKAMKYGMAALDNSELIALVIKTGYADRNVFQLADEIIAKANGFRNLLTLNFEELTEIKGIKEAKALEIMAILEIAKRLSSIDKVEETGLQEPGEVVKWLRFNIAFENTEKFMVIFLNTRGSVIRSEVLFAGSRNTSVVAVDEVLRKALIYKSSAIIVAHNHPSGDTTPSRADIDITDKIANACESIGVRFLDHIIVSSRDYYSFKREGLL